MKAFFLSLVALALITSAVHLDAHGIWFAQRSGELALIFGEGSDDEATVHRLPGVRDLGAWDASGTKVATKLVPADRLLLVDVQQKPAVVACALDNGLWTVGPDNQEVNKGKSQVPGARSSGYYMKYAVRVLGDLKTPLGALAGQTLQLTPVTAALPKRIGETVKLRALYQGKPLAGAAVTADFVNEPSGMPLRTDKDGTVTLKVRNQGLNVISVVHEVKPDAGVDADKIQHRATLSFVLPLED